MNVDIYMAILGHKYRLKSLKIRVFVLEKEAAGLHAARRFQTANCLLVRAKQPEGLICKEYSLKFGG
jgi:hypothetical protein